MPTPEQHAILTIALLAAFADGTGDDREREAIKGIAASLAGEFDAPQLTRLYQDVLLKRVDLQQATAALADRAQRQLAYEMAVCVCDADGAPNPAERAFLDQMKMVYRIGQRYGHELDRNHIKEFIATAGIGMTSQYIEQFGRKLLGGLLGGIAGGLGRGLGSVATGAAFSFAATYALGQLAKRYYAGGRQMNTALLQSTYQSLLGDAKQLQQQNIGLIREKARTLDVGQVMSMVRN